MHFLKKYRFWMLGICVLLLLGAAVLYLTVDRGEVSIAFALADAEREETKILPTMFSDEKILVLPGSVDKTGVVLYTCDGFPRWVRGSRSLARFTNGKPLNVEKICREGDYTLSFLMFPWAKEPAYQLTLRFGENLPAVYILSEDPENQGRAWVEADAFKNNKAKGCLLMQNADGVYSFAGDLTQIKGRGNTTWGFEKRPYQIKTAEKTDLLESGNDKNISKTWILLANYLDPAGLRNTLALRLGASLGMPTNIEGKSVELYYDGEYRGMYMLTEKVEVGSGRVNIVDLEKENQEENAGIDFSALPVDTATTGNGASFTYCQGMESPSNITGGYLLEMDYEVRALEEVCYFKTKRGKYVVVKSPEYASYEEMHYIATLYQEFEDAVFFGGTNPFTGKKYSDYMDRQSLASYYLINEFSKSRDTFQSSAYLYKNADSDQFFMGPLWDYDMSFGKGAPDEWVGDDVPYGLSTMQNDMCLALFAIDDFKSFVREFYTNQFLPIVSDMLEDDSYFSAERAHIAASADANARLWYPDLVWDAEADALYSFIEKRMHALSSYFETYEDIYSLPPSAFYDVFEDDPSFDAVTEISRMGILNSIGNGLFGPDMALNRAQAVQAIYIMDILAHPQVVDDAPIGTDVPVDAWYANAVTFCAQKNWLELFEDGSFRPDEPMTLEDMCDILYRYAGSPSVQTEVLASFEDEASVMKPEALAWVLDNEMLSFDGTMLSPQRSITNAELAKLLVKFCRES